MMPAVPAASTRNSSCDTISTICLSSQPHAPTSSLMLTDSAPTKRDKKNKLKTIYLVSLVIPLSRIQLAPRLCERKIDYSLSQKHFPLKELCCNLSCRNYGHGCDSKSRFHVVCMKPIPSKS
jgi:hypothetical protein